MKILLCGGGVRPTCLWLALSLQHPQVVEYVACVVTCTSPRSSLTYLHDCTGISRSLAVATLLFVSVYGDTLILYFELTALCAALSSSSTTAADLLNLVFGKKRF